MSYCRRGPDSDVYVFRTDLARTAYVCFHCCEQPTPRAMFNHLLEHRSRGDKVPDSALARLRAEIDELVQEAWLSACRVERTLKTGWSLTTTARVVAALLDVPATKARLIEILRAVDVDPNEIEYEIASINHRLNDDGSERFGGDP